jgi:hypothetical protein
LPDAKGAEKVMAGTATARRRHGMRSSQPPIVATWLLTRFGNGNEVLAGDLVEEYQRGRTAAWYWRQVLVAIFVGCGNEVRTHKLLAVRAVITGWAALILSSYLISFPLYKLYSRVLMDLGFRPLWFWWWHYYTYPIVLVPCIGGFLSGWLVARFHRAYRVTMVTVYAVSVLLTSLPEIFRLATNSLSNSRFVPYLLSHLLIECLFVVSILLGGLRSRNPQTARSLQ